MYEVSEAWCVCLDKFLQCLESINLSTHLTFEVAGLGKEY